MANYQRYIKKVHSLVISTGSNMGDRMQNLESAAGLVEAGIGAIRKSSSVYESGAWGYRSERLYYNQCHELATGLSPAGCMARILEIERSMGRVRTGRGYSDRIIDIDILFYDDLVLNRENLTIPHGRMLERKFVLIPLAEILPERKHPLAGKPVRELLELCSDGQEPVKVS